MPKKIQVNSYIKSLSFDDTKLYRQKIDFLPKDTLRRGDG